MNSKKIKLNIPSIECNIMRCGYTGEDGFEIQIHNDFVEDFAKELISQPEVMLAGLGARDTLRLEAGLCLMNQDIFDCTTPVDANLSWTIGKRRKEEKNFPGAQKILDQLENGSVSMRVGLLVEGKVPARNLCGIYVDDEQVGLVTSGGPSPSLNGAAIAMGFIDTNILKTNKKFLIDVRGKLVIANLTDLPFVPTNFYKPK